MLAIASSIIATTIKSFKYVYEGQLGIKLRFGKAIRDKKTNEPVVIHPGFVFIVPFVESIYRHHTRQRTVDLNTQKILINGGLNFEISAIIIFKIRDVYKSLFEIDDLENSIADLGKSVLRSIFARKEFAELCDVQKISNELITEMTAKTKDWGISVIDFSLTDCSPTPETAGLINLRLGAEMKFNALKEVATKMDFDIHELNSTLGAVIIGIPLQAMANVQNITNVKEDIEDVPGHSFKLVLKKDPEE